MKNSLGREIPEEILRLSDNGPYTGAFLRRGRQIRSAVSSRTVYPGEKKLLGSLKEAIALSGLQSGMTVSFHHHLRNGDRTMRLVLEAAEDLGIRDLTVAASALFGLSWLSGGYGPAGRGFGYPRELHGGRNRGKCQQGPSLQACDHAYPRRT